jgi:uncharacterized membrane protein YcaP (DUF421 family)
MVGNEVSFTNAICQIMAIGMAHYLLAWIRSRSSRFARLTDGTPLVLLKAGQWRVDTLQHMGVQDDDVMASARDSNMRSLAAIDSAILERNGEISISQRKQK